MAQKGLRPSQCRVYLQRRLAEEFPAVVERFLKEQTAKSAAHMRIVTELLEADAKPAKRKKDGIDRLLEKWAAEDARAAKQTARPTSR